MLMSVWYSYTRLDCDLAYKCIDVSNYCLCVCLASKLETTKKIGLGFCLEMIKHFDSSSPLAVPMLEAITELFIKSVQCSQALLLLLIWLFLLL